MHLDLGKAQLPNVPFKSARMNMFVSLLRWHREGISSVLFVLYNGQIFFYRTVYDIDLNSLPMADLTGSKTPVWCEICLKKGDTNKAQTYCTVCTKCFCDKHKEVSSYKPPISKIYRLDVSYQHSAAFHYGTYLKYSLRCQELRHSV